MGRMFGAGVAMIWFMARHHYTPALRVALISALGTALVLHLAIFFRAWAM
jgi:hypothetical protein